MTAEEAKKISDEANAKVNDLDVFMATIEDTAKEGRTFYHTQIRITMATRERLVELGFFVGDESYNSETNKFSTKIAWE